MECLRNPQQFPQFLNRVKSVLHKLRDEYLQDLESEDADVAGSNTGTDDSHEENRGSSETSSNHHPDSGEAINVDTTSHMPKYFNSEGSALTYHTTGTHSEEDTTDDPHGHGDGHATADGDSLGEAAGDSSDSPGDTEDSTVDSPRRKRDVVIEGFFDLEEVLDRLEVGKITKKVHNRFQETVKCFPHIKSVGFIRLWNREKER